MDRREIDIGGHAMPVLDSGGDGPPLILLHGACGDAALWRPVMAQLPQRRVIAPTLRHFGGAPLTPGAEGHGMAGHAADIAALIRTLKLAPADVAGWSFGGGIALALAIAAPRLVRALYAFEPGLTAHFADTDTDAAQAAAADRAAMGAAARPLLEAGDSAGAALAFLDATADRPGATARWPAELRAVAARNGVSLPMVTGQPPQPVTHAALAAVALPVTIAHGAATRPYFRLAAGAAAGAIPGARSEAVPGADHLWPVDDPDGFAAALDRALPGRAA